MKLLSRVGNKLSLQHKDDVLSYIKKLRSISENNPTKNMTAKLKSLFASETFSSLLTEGEISSRRNLRNIFKDSNPTLNTSDRMITNFADAFQYVLNQRKFSISNIYTLYNLLSKDVLDQEDLLLDGNMYRHDNVYIGSNKMNNEYMGFDHKDIPDAIKDLIIFLDDQSEDIYLRAIIGHLYFEMIHPFFDYNGRTGRFIPLWLFANEGKAEEMLYFATAMGNYREQYLAIFRNNIDSRTYEVNLDRMVIKVTKLLILNQYQYIWLKKQELKYISVTNKSFSSFQKDFIWLLMKKSELSKNSESWFKLNKRDKEFIELNWRDATLSVEAKKLIDAKIIKSTNDKPKKYQLLNYKLIDFDDIKN